MSQIFVRFLVGGTVISVFAAVGDVLKPKSFAGLFGAAPSVALATLGLAIGAEGASYAAIEARSQFAPFTAENDARDAVPTFSPIELRQRAPAHIFVVDVA